MRINGFMGSPGAFGEKKQEAFSMGARLVEEIAKTQNT